MSRKITFEQASIGDYKYSDLYLDIDFLETPKGAGGLYRPPIQSDIKIDLDEHAIVNSIRNLFSTRRGQMLLNPEYGLNLERFLFQPINSFVAKAIAREIINGVEKYEPRVKVNAVHVQMDIEQMAYRVFIHIEIPSLRNKRVTLTGIFSNGVL